MGGLSIWHWLVVIVVVMLLFGRGKISDLMGDVAKGVKSFKKGLADDDESDDRPSRSRTRRRFRRENQGQGLIRALRADRPSCRPVERAIASAAACLT